MPPISRVDHGDPNICIAASQYWLASCAKRANIGTQQTGEGVPLLGRRGANIGSTAGDEEPILARRRTSAAPQGWRTMGIQICIASSQYWLASCAKRANIGTQYDGRRRPFIGATRSQYWLDGGPPPHLKGGGPWGSKALHHTLRIGLYGLSFGFLLQAIRVFAFCVSIGSMDSLALLYLGLFLLL